MNTQFLKSLIQNVANSFGFRITRINAGGQYADPFYEMLRLTDKTISPVIFDVGAHHGLTAKKFSKTIPRAAIYCFEPFPESFVILQKNTKFKKNISVHNFGLGNRDCKLKFYSNSSSSTNSLLPTSSKANEIWGNGFLETKEIIQTNFKKLDSVLSELRIPKVNILKMDVQGAEYLVMNGGNEAFTKNAIDIIYTEIIIQETYENQKRFDKILELFYDYKFQLHNFYNLSYTNLGKLRQVDAIFTSCGMI